VNYFIRVADDAIMLCQSFQPACLELRDYLEDFTLSFDFQRATRFNHIVQQIENVGP
jgi:hypothetical protein